MKKIFYMARTSQTPRKFDDHCKIQEILNKFMHISS